MVASTDPQAGSVSVESNGARLCAPPIATAARSNIAPMPGWLQDIVSDALEHPRQVRTNRSYVSKLSLLSYMMPRSPSRNYQAWSRLRNTRADSGPTALGHIDIIPEVKRKRVRSGPLVHYMFTNQIGAFTSFRSNHSARRNWARLTAPGPPRHPSPMAHCEAGASRHLETCPSTPQI